VARLLSLLWGLHLLRLSMYSAPGRSKAGTCSSLSSFHREPLLLGGLSCQDAQCPSSGWSVLTGQLFSQLLSSPLEEVIAYESSSLGKKPLDSFPPWCEQMRGKVSITILYSRSQLGAGRLENSGLDS